MMKKKTVRMLLRVAAAMILCCLPACALAFDAGIAKAWLDQFAAAVGTMAPINDPAATSDPARAGQLLLEYDFGTVLAANGQPQSAADILEIDVRTSQVTDCRGVRVGMSLESALGGARTGPSGTQLYVLDMQEKGWSWAYVNDGGIYGVEYIAYGEDGQTMHEYTLTYVITQGAISAIRMKTAKVTQAQALDGIETAREIASRQDGEVLASPNQAAVFSQDDLLALGKPVYELIARMGEPEEIQTLPEGRGRILVYEGAAVRLALNERTGVEVVRGISTTANQTVGPRGLSVGLSVQEAAALFLCEQEVSSLGGTLYLAGEALGDAPYGELVVYAGAPVLRYACRTEAGDVALLEAGVEDGYISYWHLYFENDAEGGV